MSRGWVENHFQLTALNPTHLFFSFKMFFAESGWRSANSTVFCGKSNLTDLIIEIDFY